MSAIPAAWRLAGGGDADGVDGARRVFNAATGGGVGGLVAPPALMLMCQPLWRLQ